MAMNRTQVAVRLSAALIASAIVSACGGDDADDGSRPSAAGDAPRALDPRGLPGSESAWGYRWSADGSRVAYIDGGVLGMNSGDRLVIEQESEDGEFEVLGMARIDARGWRGVAWSPVQEVVAVAIHETWMTESRDIEGSVELLLVSIDGESAPIRSWGNAEISNPVWSPDGERVAVVVTENDQAESHLDSVEHELVIIDVSDGSSSSTRLHGPEDPFQQCLAWSPAGRWLAVVIEDVVTIVDEDGPDPVGTAELELAGMHGRQPPQWSPDGQRLALLVSSGAVLFHVDGEGALTVDRSANLEHSLGGMSSVAWSPDGRSLYATRVVDGTTIGDAIGALFMQHGNANFSHHLRRIPLDGGDPESLPFPSSETLRLRAWPGAGYVLSKRIR